MRCNRYMMLGVALVMVTTGMSQPYPTKLLSNEQQIESLIQQPKHGCWNQGRYSCWWVARRQNCLCAARQNYKKRCPYSVGTS